MAAMSVTLNDPIAEAHWIAQPKKLKTVLFQHQRHNITKMAQLEEYKEILAPNGDIISTNVGVLGDKPGTGKTYTIIGLLCQDVAWWKKTQTMTTFTAVNLAGNIAIRKQQTFKTINTNLVICSGSILKQWAKELAQTSLTVAVIDTKAKAKSTEVAEYDVVLCLNTMYNSVIEENAKYAWKRVIYDEVDSAYIMKMSPIVAGFIWLVSATSCAFMDEVNRSRSHYLKTVFNKIQSNADYNPKTFMESITLRAPINLVKMATDAIPEYKTTHYQVAEAKLVKNLGKFMEAKIQELVTAGNTEEAIKLLGGKSSNDSIAQLLRAKLITELKEAEAKIVEHSGNRHLQKNWIAKKVSCETRLDDLDAKIKEMESADCTICCEPITAPVLLSCCQNLTCAKCIASHLDAQSKRIIAHSCPFCRSLEVKKRMVHMSKYAPPAPAKKTKVKVPSKILTKLDVISTIVAKANSRVLIFASDSHAFADLEQHLAEMKIGTSQVKGTHTQREHSLEKFFTGECPVLLLNSRVNGAGLNLQHTTDVVVYNKMEAHLLQQLIGRAYRIGQQKTIRVHTFHQDEAE